MKFPQENWRMVLKLTVCGAVVVAVLAFVLAERSGAQLPRQRVITLKAGDDLQAALRSARFGDTILLQPGATYVGPIVLPFKSGGYGTDADYITIRSSDLEGIANIGERIKPALHAHAMPKIVAPNERRR